MSFLLPAGRRSGAPAYIIEPTQFSVIQLSGGEIETPAPHEGTSPGARGLPVNPRARPPQSPRPRSAARRPGRRPLRSWARRATRRCP
ncbi:hypothetical protein QJS66_13725 [Kocuria rhizophila]|nr:hypothetical protein QJS66_13725 [Kocuria rhizophila]